MKHILLLIIFFLTAQVSRAEATDADVVEDFKCQPDAKIKNRVNSFCLAPLDMATDVSNKKYPIKNGVLLITSQSDHEGRVHLKISHHCRNSKKSKSVTYETFCGYQKSEFDRTSPPALEIREKYKKTAMARVPDFSQVEIDRLVSREMNAWVADPLKNIESSSDLIRIKILKNSYGTTCVDPQDLEYKVNCK